MMEDFQYPNQKWKMNHNLLPTNPTKILSFPTTGKIEVSENDFFNGNLSY
jgi:hypothetical protein